MSSGIPDRTGRVRGFESVAPTGLDHFPEGPLHPVGDAAEWLPVPHLERRSEAWIGRETRGEARRVHGQASWSGVIRSHAPVVGSIGTRERGTTEGTATFDLRESCDLLVSTG